MLATNAPRWNGRDAGPGWQSVGVSIAVTVAAFVVAFAAMMPVPRWLALRRVSRDLPPMVRLEPPAAQIQRPLPATNPAARATMPRPVAPAAVPTTVPTTSIAPPLTTPITSAPPPDSSAGSKSGATAPVGPVTSSLGFPNNPRAGIPGAAVAPAGVTEHGRFLDLPGVRDSIAAQKMALLELLARTQLPTGAVLAELESRRRVAERLARRATTAGNASDVHVMLGEGLDGVGAVNGGRTSLSPLGGSIPLPLFSSGPSAAQRRKDEKLDAEYQLRLRRLRARARLLAAGQRLDSSRVDSLRRDSLAKLAQRRAP
jgi:hypothetical protein